MPHSGVKKKNRMGYDVYNGTSGVMLKWCHGRSGLGVFSPPWIQHIHKSRGYGVFCTPRTFPTMGHVQDQEVEKNEEAGFAVRVKATRPVAAWTAATKLGGQSCTTSIVRSMYLSIYAQRPLKVVCPPFAPDPVFHPYLGTPYLVRRSRTTLQKTGGLFMLLDGLSQMDEIDGGWETVVGFPYYRGRLT